MASSLEEVSGTPGNEPSNAAPPNDHFGVFKDFDFLEYESESIEVRHHFDNDTGPKLLRLWKRDTNVAASCFHDGKRLAVRVVG